MAIPFSIVDCRVEASTRGVAAAVVQLRKLEADAWMRDLAAFLAVPVTAFARPAPGGHRTRLFVPGSEVEFSGEGLAAAAHALWEGELVQPGPVLLLTALAEVEARRVGPRTELARAGRTVFELARTVTVARGELAWPA